MGFRSSLLFLIIALFTSGPAFAGPFFYPFPATLPVDRGLVYSNGILWSQDEIFSVVGALYLPTVFGEKAFRPQGPCLYRLGARKFSVAEAFYLSQPIRLQLSPDAELLIDSVRIDLFKGNLDLEAPVVKARLILTLGAGDLSWKEEVDLDGQVPLFASGQVNVNIRLGGGEAHSQGPISWYSLDTRLRIGRTVSMGTVDGELALRLAGKEILLRVEDLVPGKRGAYLFAEKEKVDFPWGSLGIGEVELGFEGLRVESFKAKVVLSFPEVGGVLRGSLRVGDGALVVKVDSGEVKDLGLSVEGGGLTIGEGTVEGTLIGKAEVRVGEEVVRLGRSVEVRVEGGRLFSDPFGVNRRVRWRGLDLKIRQARFNGDVVDLLWEGKLRGFRQLGVKGRFSYRADVRSVDVKVYGEIRPYARMEGRNVWVGEERLSGDWSIEEGRLLFAGRTGKGEAFGLGGEGGIGIRLEEVRLIAGGGRLDLEGRMTVIWRGTELRVPCEVKGVFTDKGLGLQLRGRDLGGSVECRESGCKGLGRVSLPGEYLDRVFGTSAVPEDPVGYWQLARDVVRIAGREGDVVFQVEIGKSLRGRLSFPREKARRRELRLLGREVEFTSRQRYRVEIEVEDGQRSLRKVGITRMVFDDLMVIETDTGRRAVVDVGLFRLTAMGDEVVGTARFLLCRPQGSSVRLLWPLPGGRIPDSPVEVRIYRQDSSGLWQLVGASRLKAKPVRVAGETLLPGADLSPWEELYLYLQVLKGDSSLARDLGLEYTDVPPDLKRNYRYKVVLRGEEFEEVEYESPNFLSARELPEGKVWFRPTRLKGEEGIVWERGERDVFGFAGGGWFGIWAGRPPFRWVCVRSGCAELHNARFLSRYIAKVEGYIGE